MVAPCGIHTWIWVIVTFHFLLHLFIAPTQGIHTGRIASDYIRNYSCSLFSPVDFLAFERRPRSTSIRFNSVHLAILLFNVAEHWISIKLCCSLRIRPTNVSVHQYRRSEWADQRQYIHIFGARTIRFIFFIFRFSFQLIHFIASFRLGCVRPREEYDCAVRLASLYL